MSSFFWPPQSGGSSSGVSDVNGLTGSISLAAGTGITITPSGNTLTLAATGASGVAWGAITGTLSSQTDLQNALNAKANLTGATFTGSISATNLSGTNTGDVTLGTADGLSLAGQVLSLALASTSTTGALSSTDWNTFNGKQASGNYITALTGDATAAGPGSVALTLATVNPNVGTWGTASQTPIFTVNGKGLVTAVAELNIAIAESQVTNLVSDLAGKQATGNYITALTGDLTAAGPGSVAGTLATVNANVGAFGSATAVATFTVNAKGLTTAAGSTSIQIAESQVTNLVSDLAGKQATLTIGNLTDVGTDGIVVTGGTGAVIGAGVAIAQHVADATHNGYLSSTDWNTFTTASGGGISSISIASTNGFAGTSSGGTTPALTLSTSITGILQGNGTAISAATTTGTGSVVLATAPTLSNPVVGTQTQGDNSTKSASTAYVDLAVSNAVSGINPAVAVQAATTAAGDTSGFTYNNGVSGVGATFTGLTNTAVVIDGFTFTALNQRLLVKNDTQSPSGAFNGIYVVTQLQTVGLPPILTRALDYDQPSDMNNTGAIPVINGTVNGTTQWVLSSQVVTVGTTPLTYTLFSKNPASYASSTLTSAHLFVGNASNVATDTAITGDVTISNAGVTAIGTNKVANTQLAQMAAHTFKGNNTGSTANAIDLSISQMQSDLSIPISSSPLALNAGGTGTSAASANAAFNALSPMTTGGDLIYGGASGVATRLANGSAGNVLVSGGGTSAPVWTTNARTINTQTGTTYTFVLADGSGTGGQPLVTASNASAQTYTVPTNASVAFPVGTQIDLLQLGAGKLTVAGAGGVTVSSQAGNLSIAAQFVGVSIIKTATNTWILIGNLIA